MNKVERRAGKVKQRLKNNARSAEVRTMVQARLAAQRSVKAVSYIASAIEAEQQLMIASSFAVSQVISQKKGVHSQSFVDNCQGK